MMNSLDQAVAAGGYLLLILGEVVIGLVLLFGCAAIVREIRRAVVKK